MTAYQRDFTIGLRETMDFYTFLTMRHWRKGFAGFGVHVTVGKDKARLGFENLRRVAETRKAFYLFLSDSQGWILPKRQMEDPQGESEQLRGIFRTVVERGKLELKG